LEEVIGLSDVIELKDNKPAHLLPIKENKYYDFIEDNQISGSGEYYYYWSTARASVKVRRGTWYFEVIIKSKGSCRIGWCTDKYTSTEGLGCDEHSWAFDGYSQKKYHNSSDGVKFGEGWSRGDIIGCRLDIEQRRVLYYKNGKPLGIAFGSLRLVNLWMFPAVSVGYDTTVIVNLGNEFAFPPPGCFGLNPLITPKQRAQLEDLFKVYSITTETEELIAGEKLVLFAQDMGSTGPLDPTLLIIAWLFFSSRQWQFLKSEWLCSWTLQGVFTLNRIKEAVDHWRTLINTQDDIWKSFYQFIFDYLKSSPKSNNIDKQEALVAWHIVGIDKRWELWEKWEKFWNESPSKLVSKDVWNMLIRFIDKIGTNLKNYDENDSWPLAIDEFVRANRN